MSTTRYVDVDRTLSKLENTEIHPENIEAIHEFINHQAAEGISDVQQERQIQSLKTLLKKFAPTNFRLKGASESELKTVLAKVNRSDYADSTKHKFKGTIKKFYKVENGGYEHPEKVNFFKVTRKKATPVTRDDLFTDEELKQLLQNFSNIRDKAFTLLLYESAARPGELQECSINDFTSNRKGDFIFLQGKKNTPDRTNQLIRGGRTLREWISQHPLGGELGDIKDPSAPLWVKTEQQSCKNCGKIPHHHSDTCSYEPDPGDRITDQGFRQRFKDACERAEIPENKRRPYNLRHTRLTEVATFMGYEQLNKFAGWVPGSDRAKVYVHLNNDDVNQAIRDEYGLNNSNEEENQSQSCPFCSTENQANHTECRNCGRPLSLKQKADQKEKQRILERLSELEDKGILEKLRQLEDSGKHQNRE